MATFTTSDGCALEYRFDGDQSRPVVLLSNSLGSTVEMWEPQIAALTQHFHVLRYDNRGHGRSGVPQGPYTIERIALDAKELIEALGVGPVLYCGVSLGGMVGMWLCQNAPHLVSRVVLANTTAYFGQPETWNQRLAAVDEQGMQAVAESVIQRWLTKDFIDQHPAETARYVSMIASTPPDGYKAAILAVRDVDLRSGLAGITLPVLVIAGAVDVGTPPAMAEAIADAIPSARLAILDAAHLSNIEKADEFNKLVIRFLTAD
jgi:3-oxoadipate enol-lactonase